MLGGIHIGGDFVHAWQGVHDAHRVFHAGQHGGFEHVQTLDFQELLLVKKLALHARHVHNVGQIQGFFETV